MKPCGVRTFASFLVDLDCVPLWDLHADDNGTWATKEKRSAGTKTGMCSSSSNWGPLSPYTYHLHLHFSPYNSSYGYHPDSQPFGSFGPFPPNASVVSPIPQLYSWSVPSFSPRAQQEAEQRAYVVKLLNNRINCKKCRGCGAGFSRKVDSSPLGSLS